MPKMELVADGPLSPEGTAWLADLLARIETLDVAEYVAAMADDVQLVLQNGAVVLSGPDAVLAAFTEPWSTLAGLEHTELAVAGDDHHFVHESEVRFTALDGSVTTARSTAWIDRNDAGQLVRARVYGAA